MNKTIQFKVQFNLIGSMLAPFKGRVAGRLVTEIPRGPDLLMRQFHSSDTKVA